MICLVLGGQLTVRYTNEKPFTKETFGPGDRVNVWKGQLYEFWAGDKGCTFACGFTLVNPESLL